MHRPLSLAQWSTYLSWLEDRGLPYPTLRPRDEHRIGLASEADSSDADLLRPIQSEIAVPAAPAPEIDPDRGPGPTKLRLLLIAQGLDAEAPRQMVEKIVGALGLKPADCRIVNNASELAHSLRQAHHLLVFGREGAQLLAEAGLRDFRLYELVSFADEQHMLLLPHPVAMLAQPQLKVRAWEGLQKLRAILLGTSAT